MKTGLFIGRFQPFHKGHKESIESISEKVDEIVIGIGSADSSHNSKNPFTAGERIRMIQRSLQIEGTNIYTIPIVDIDRNSVWVSHVESLSPDFSVVYTNNKLVTRLFEEAGYKVKNHEKVSRDVLSGTEIRKRIVEDEDWEDLVPSAVVDQIERLDGKERIKRVTR